MSCGIPRRRSVVMLTLLAGAALALFAAQTVSVNAADEPDYPHGDWSGDCALCHVGDKYVPLKLSKDFKHAAAVPLAGAHAAVKCRACHKSLEFPKIGKRLCVDCHQDVHRGEFGQDCARCHTTRTFIDRAELVRSHRTTRFPLSGAHAFADCEACHRTGPEDALVYVGLSSSCADCHDSTGFPAATQRPQNHDEADFPEDCSRCHSTFSFSGARFNHAGTGFSLTGAHLALDCVRCHGTPFNTNLDPACVSCHLADYQATTSPDHEAVGFSQDCQVCHNTTAFKPAHFDHSGTGFPLTGAHVGLECVQCHGDPFNTNLDPACASCHLADYQAQTDPNHVAAGFSQQCQLCHTTTTFAGARYTEHDTLYFPIYSGTHSGRWSRCSDCHTNSSNYSQFSCLTCHTQNETNSRHSGMQGYSYNSAACYACHPQGRAED